MSDENDQKICRRDFIRNTAITGLSAFVMAGVVPKVFSESKQEKPDPVQSEIPFVKIPDVRIKMSHRDSFLVGVSGSEVVEISLSDVLKFHGYCAAGVTLAFRKPRKHSDCVWRQPPHSSGHQGTDRLSLLSGRGSGLYNGGQNRLWCPYKPC